MITIFVTKEGYYINGEGIEVALRCSPALDDHGNPLFHELHHTYKVMFLALQAVAQKKSISGEVIVYNDSRLVDELNGWAPPLDEACGKWLLAIRREIIPHIRTIVNFRKKTSEYVKSQVKLGDTILTPNDPVLIASIASKIENLKKEQSQGLKNRVLNRFRKMWTNDQNQ